MTSGFGQAAVMGVAFLLLAPVVWRLRRNASPTARRGRPSAAWADQFDYPGSRKSAAVPAPPGSIVVGIAFGRPVRIAPGHSLFLTGASGAGKTAGVTAPTVLEWDHGPALVIAGKAAIVRDTSGWRNRLGRVDVFDPAGMTGLRCSGWSHLPRAREWATAVEIGDDVSLLSGTTQLGGSDHWRRIAADGIAALFHAAAVDGAGMDRVVSWARRHRYQEAEQILTRAGAAEARETLLGTFKTGDDRLTASSWSTVRTALAAYADPLALAVSSPEEISADRLLAGPNTVYALADPHRQDRIAPLLLGLFNEIVAEAVARGVRGQRTNLLIVLDEAATSVRIPSLAALASTVRELGITLVTSMQDLEQAHHRYKDEAGTVINGHVATLVGSGIRDERTLRTLERVVGDEYPDGYSESRSGFGLAARSETVNPEGLRRPVLPARQVREIPRGEGVLLYEGRPPLRLTFRRGIAGEEQQLGASIGERTVGTAGELAPRYLPPATGDLDPLPGQPPPAAVAAGDRPAWSELMSAVITGTADRLGEETIHRAGTFYEPVEGWATPVTDPARLVALRILLKRLADNGPVTR